MKYAAGALTGLTQEQLREMAAFAKQTGNPYVNRIGDYVVKVCYQKEGSTIDEKMEEYIRRLAKVYV